MSHELSAILVLIVGVAAGLLCFPFFPARSKGLDVFPVATHHSGQLPCIYWY